MRIRTAEQRDVAAVARVCRATARNGDPVAESDPAAALLTAVYAEPYLLLQPRAGRVLVDATDAVVGYAVAAVDSRAFYARWRREWSPRYPPPSGAGDEADLLLRLVAEPERMLPDDATVEAFPSHLHIDLLPQARSRGQGRALLTSGLAGLAACGSPGVHLGVDPGNERARQFYQRAGFTPAAAQPLPGTLVLVRRLTRGG